MIKLLLIVLLAIFTAIKHCLTFSATFQGGPFKTNNAKFIFKFKKFNLRGFKNFYYWRTVEWLSHIRIFNLQNATDLEFFSNFLVILTESINCYPLKIILFILHYHYNWRTKNSSVSIGQFYEAVWHNIILCWV
jgi:hypothetical protein